MYQFILQKSYQQPITPEFQKKYANIVLELDNLNKDLNEYLIGVQQYCQEVNSCFFSNLEIRKSWINNTGLFLVYGLQWTQSMHTPKFP